MSADTRTASIIIPCTRLNSVKRTIDSLLNQVNCLDNYEIIVVGRQLAGLKENYSNHNINFLETSCLCPASKARNLGARHAKGDILIFIDDDCEASPGFIETYLNKLADPAIGILTGKIVGKSDRFFAKCSDYGSCYGQMGDKEEALNKLNSTSLAIRREVFERLNGFDEAIIIQEDIDIALRTIKLGLRVLYYPQVVVWHNHGKNTFMKLIKFNFRYGSLAGLNVALKHKTGLKNKIKILARKFYIFFIIPFAMWSTYKAGRQIAALSKRALIYMPFIFISNVSYQIGVFKWTLNHAEK